MPDVFVDHAKPEVMYAQAKLDSAGIVETVFEVIGKAEIANISTS